MYIWIAVVITLVFSIEPDCPSVNNRVVTSDPYLTYLFGTFPMSPKDRNDLWNRREEYREASNQRKLNDESEPSCRWLRRLVEQEEDFRTWPWYDDPWNNATYLVNYTEHLDLAHSSINSSPNTCTDGEKTKFISVFHEYNLPYEVPCTHCEKDLVYGSSYHMYKSGRVGRDETWSVPERLLSNVMGFSNNQVQSSHEWSKREWESRFSVFLIDPLGHGAIFYAERKTNIENLKNETDIFADLDLTPTFTVDDSSLLVTPGLELYKWKEMLLRDRFANKPENLRGNERNEYWQHFYWNSGSFYCTKKQSTWQDSPDVIVNVDSLIHPYDTKIIDDKHKTGANFVPDGRYPYKADDWRDEMFNPEKRFKVGDYEPFDDNNDVHRKLDDGINISDWNMQLRVNWREWSCCSRCCCTEDTCGPDFDWTGDCEYIPSYRHRIGFLSWFKLRKDEQLLLPNEITKVAPRAYKEFNDLLSQKPYRDEGIPVFSTMFNAAVEPNSSPEVPEWQKLEEFLFKEISKPPYSLPYRDTYPKEYALKSIQNYPAGGLGMLIDLKECSLEEKRDCNELLKCREGIVSTSEQVTKEPTTIPTTPLPRICDNVNHYQELRIDYKDNRVFFVEVKEGRDYMIRIYKDGKPMDRLHWHLGTDQTHIDRRNRSLECFLHQVFVENSALYLIGLHSNDIRRPYIVQDQRSLRLKVVLHFEQKEVHSDVQRNELNNFFWVGILIITVSVLLGVLGLCYLSYLFNYYETHV